MVGVSVLVGMCVMVGVSVLVGVLVVVAVCVHVGVGVAGTHAPKFTRTVWPLGTRTSTLSAVV
ncbi:MAG: hypothetical protein H5T63_06020 [Chloroflexi bacterium]|nr:hypothetical protein [Chloroflexota bacterium]